MLKTGIPLELLPQEMGYGSGMTCWRRLQDWQKAGVWYKLHQKLLEQLHRADRIDWSSAVVDSASVRSALGGPHRTQPLLPIPVQVVLLEGLSRMAQCGRPISL